MKYYIYGAGKNLNEVLEKTAFFLDVEGILDNDIEKIGTKVNSINIISAEAFLDAQFDKNEHRIIVSVTNPSAKKEIEDTLTDKGLKKGCEFLNASDFCKFYFERKPGTTTGVIDVPDGFTARISFDPNSYLIRSTDNRIFRVIKPNVVEKTEKIYEKCKSNNLFGEYIVDSWIRDDIHGFENQMLIEHEYISPISFCFEWPPLMYEDYVLYMLELVQKLTDSGLGLVDAHGLNATFYKGKFIFYDFGAIGYGLTSPIEIQEIVNTLVIPLVLMKLGQKDRAYFYLKDHSITLGIRDIKGYLSDEEFEKFREIYEAIIYTYSKNKITEVLDLIRKYIKDFKVSKKTGAWEDYQDNEWNREPDKTKWSIKMVNAISMIKRVSPGTIVDIAGNQGWYGSYLRDQLDHAVIADMDTTALDKLWERIKREKIDNVIPVYMSICAPSLGRHYDGFVDGNTIKPIRQSGCERYRSELAVALAIVHHMAFREQLSFREIIDVLSVYTDKYLLVEFVSQDDRFIAYFIKDGFEWYTKEAFEDALKSRYEVIDQKESSPVETRTLYLCKKIVPDS